MLERIPRLLDLDEGGELVHREWAQVQDQLILDATGTPSGVGRDELSLGDRGAATNRVQDVRAEHHVQHLFHGDRLDDLGDRGVLVRIQRVEGVQVEGDCRVFQLDRPLERGTHGPGHRLAVRRAASSTGRCSSCSCAIRRTCFRAPGS